MIIESVAGPASHAGPLSSDQLAQLAAARARARKIRRAVAAARFSGWTTAIFGGLTLIGGLFSVPALLLGLAMLACAITELRAASRLRELHPGAPARLAWNQGALCVSICAYCGWNLYAALTGPSSLATPALEGAGEIVASAEELARGISAIVYGSAIFISILVQGLTALYYASRARFVRDYVRATPAWVIDVQRAA